MFYTFRTQLIVIFALLFLIPFVTMAYVYWTQATAAIRESIEISTAQTMDQYAEFVDRSASQIANEAGQILSSDVTQSWIGMLVESGSDRSDANYLQQQYRLKKWISSQVSNNENILSVNLFYRNRDLWNLEAGDYTGTNWYAAYADTGSPWVPVHYDLRQSSTFMRNIGVVSYLFPLTELQSLDTVGLIKINIDARYFLEPLEKLTLGKTGRFYLLDAAGNPVLGQRPAAIPDDVGRYIRLASAAEARETIRLRERSGGYLYFVQHIQKTGWVLVGEVSEAELYGKITAARQHLLVVAAALFVVAVALAYGLSSAIARPLSQVVRSMGFVERGNFVKAGAIMAGIQPRQTEIGSLTANYAKMVQRLQAYIKTEFVLNVRRRNAEYKALLLQINPHFLNNTLEVIHSLAAQQRHRDIRDVVGHLSKMLRYSLHLDSDLIALKDEISYIRAFMAIMSICYGERIRFDIDNDGFGDELLIPKLLLQPLVENAVKYSLEAVETAVVSISFRKRDGVLDIRIRDNGKGMPAALIRDVMSAPDDAVGQALDHPQQGIGLRNVVARCRLHYGDKCSVAIQSEPAEGTEIRLQLPAGE